MKPLLVLGMLRSGTSATTRALGLLGASMGPESSMGMFWENQPMRRVNRALLDAFGGDWESPPVLPEGWVQSPEAQALVPQARGDRSTRSSAARRSWCGRTPAPA